MDAQSLRENLVFRVLRRQPSVSFSEPRIEEYESEKHIRVVVPRVQLSLGQLPALTLSDESIAALNEHPMLERGWQCFFSRRIRAAQLGTSTRIASLFPGHTVAGSAAGNSSRSARYRGSLVFHQFLDLLSFDGGRPSISDLLDARQGNAGSLSPVPKDKPWAWSTVRRPSLSFIELPEGRDECEPNEIIGYLQRQISVRLKSERIPVKDLLERIHGTWTVSAAPHYSELSLRLAGEIIAGASLSGSVDLLPLLFEIEAYASYSTLAERINPFASGLYSNSWIEVGTALLTRCRPTELCESERLIDELVNLTSRGFAPLIINEYGCVVDGNHRLTAAWIWNLLKYCADCAWDLDDREFQDNVGKFVRSKGRKLNVITRHEMLSHLATFLSNPVQKRRLIRRVLPLIERSAAIDSLPAMLLPEYLSCPVMKSAYDEGRGRVRVMPHVFELMTTAPHAVLPPRAAYHFTDCSLLPWFSILKPDIRLV